MTTSGRHPIDTVVENDRTDGFRNLGDFSSRYALERAGSIEVTLRKNGREEFQIELVDRLFRDSKKALRPEKPAIINLSVVSLFDLVQKCRTRWQQAINSVKSTVANPNGRGEKTYSPYEELWDRPVDEESFRKIGGSLADAGAKLFEGVFESNKDTPLDKVAEKLREAAFSGKHALTVNAADFHLPWRMLYTHPHPNDPLRPDGANYDPRGFWGYQHIIEQFTNNYQIKDHVSSKDGQLGFGAGLHERIDTRFHVECLARHRGFVLGMGNRLRYVEWTKKSEVTNGLSTKPFMHQVVYFLCHAEAAGTGDKPALQTPVLRVTDGKIDVVELRESINHRFGGSRPFVFINACCAGQLGMLVRHNFTFATEFLEQGAISLIGPQIEVPAIFAGEFGKRFFERFTAQKARPPQVGVILRHLTRHMWRHRNPFGLAYSLYAGADCHIRWDGGRSA